VRTPINHQAPALSLADCKHCQRASRALA
jgi:hypothetical protein